MFLYVLLKRISSLRCWLIILLFIIVWQLRLLLVGGPAHPTTMLESDYSYKTADLIWRNSPQVHGHENQNNQTSASHLNSSKSSGDYDYSDWSSDYVEVNETRKDRCLVNMTELVLEGHLQPNETGQLLKPVKSTTRYVSPFDRMKQIELLQSQPQFVMPLVVSGPREIWHKGALKENINNNIVASAKNVTPTNVRLVLYNRVPKAGSTTFQRIVTCLADRNNFTHLQSRYYHKYWLNAGNLTELLTHLYNGTEVKRKLYDRHLFFVNVARLKFPEVAWINLVREPVSRYISNYYFTRDWNRWSYIPYLKKNPTPPKWWFNMTLDDCIEFKRPECLPSSTDQNLQLSFFCGHHPECRQTGNRRALQRAKRHAENYYSVVGLMEEMPLSMFVFEKYLPSFFNGTDQSPLSSGTVLLNRGKQPLKHVVSSKTRKILTSFLKEDIEFYEFLRQRLHIQAKSLRFHLEKLSSR